MNFKTMDDARVTLSITHSRTLSSGQQTKDTQGKNDNSLLESPNDLLRIKSSSQVTACSNDVSKFSISEGNNSPNFNQGRPAHRMRPNSAKLDELDNRNRAGSFVSSNRSIQAKYNDRIPCKLIFKNKKLQEFAEKNLKTSKVMALKDLSVDEFIFEILHSMKVPPFKPNTRT